MDPSHSTVYNDRKTITETYWGKKEMKENVINFFQNVFFSFI